MSLDLFGEEIVEERVDTRCGHCVFMDTSRSGCFPGELGRCMNSKASQYYLNPENMKVNDWMDEGQEGKRPEHEGSWAWVAKDSCGCAVFARKK
jgi:hypothetical protein